MSFVHFSPVHRGFAERFGVAFAGSIVPLLLSLLALLFAGEAGAACSQIQPPPELYVGNTATDAACTQNNIQAAI
ncbi:MAG: hypothetical protein ABI451_13235, partial [Dokdonella sp.]